MTTTILNAGNALIVLLVVGFVVAWIVSIGKDVETLTTLAKQQQRTLEAIADLLRTRT